MSETSFLSISNRIKSYREKVIEIQTRLTAIPALGPENNGDGEAKKSEYIKELLKELNYDTLEEVNAPDNRVPSGYRPNLIMKIHGRSHQKTIWIMSHMDIVPAGDSSAWDSDPFTVIEKNGKLYGRGTEDNNQGIVSSILAIKALREENILPEYDVGLAIISDEETGSGYGIDYVLKTKPELLTPNDLIIIPDAGDPEGITIEIAEKSILWIKCETHGKQTHGSTPEKGINAHKAAAYFIVKMNELYKIFKDSDPLFDPPISTFEPTQKETNVENINTIPGNDICYFDCRILPEISLKDVKKQIRQWADKIEHEYGVKIVLSYPQTVEAPSPTPANSPVVKALKKSLKEVLGKEAKTIGIGGGTVASFFRQVGLPAVCWSKLDDVLHGPNEYCRIDNVLSDAQIFAHIFLQK